MHWLQSWQSNCFNSSPPGQNGRHFADDLFRCIFVNVKVCILIEISLKFVPKDLINNNLAFGLDNGLVPNRRQAIIWTNADPVYWRIYAALWGDELKNVFKCLQMCLQTPSNVKTPMIYFGNIMTGPPPVQRWTPRAFIIVQVTQHVFRSIHPWRHGFLVHSGIIKINSMKGFHPGILVTWSLISHLGRWSSQKESVACELRSDNSFMNRDTMS